MQVRGLWPQDQGQCSEQQWERELQVGVGKALILSALGGAIVFRSKSATETHIKSRSGYAAQM